MSYSPPPWRYRHHNTIHVFSREALGGIIHMDTGVAAATWPTANRAMYYPFRIGRTVTLTQMFTFNGTSSGNIDVAVYNEGFTRLVSAGSTAMAGASAVQYFNVTDTVLTPGAYYMAVAVDNTTASFERANIECPVLAAFGVLQESAAFALPATATPALYTAEAGGAGMVPHMGFLCT